MNIRYTNYLIITSTKKQMKHLPLKFSDTMLGDKYKLQWNNVKPRSVFLYTSEWDLMNDFRNSVEMKENMMEISETKLFNKIFLIPNYRYHLAYDMQRIQFNDMWMLARNHQDMWSIFGCNKYVKEPKERVIETCKIFSKIFNSKIKIL